MKIIRLILLFLLLSLPILLKADIDYDWTKEKSLKLEKITLTELGRIDPPRGLAQGFAVTPTHFVIAVVTMDNQKASIYFVNRKTLKTDKIINNYVLGHANDFAYNSKTKQLVLPYIINDEKYVAYFDAVNLSYIRADKTDVITFALGYNNNEDIYYYRIENSTYTVDSNFKNIKKVFDNNDYANLHLVKQGMAINDNKLYYSVCEIGLPHFYQNGRYSSKRSRDSIIAISDTKGNFLKSFHIPYEEDKYEIESIDFDENGQMYLLFNSIEGNSVIFKMNYENSKIDLELKIEKDNLQDNEYTFKLMDGNNTLSEKTNVGDTIKFENITIADTGTKNFKIIDLEDNKEYTATVNVKADTFIKKLLPSVKYDDKDELIINKNIKPHIRNKTHLFVSIMSIVASLEMIICFILIAIQRKK